MNVQYIVMMSTVRSKVCDVLWNMFSTLHIIHFWFTDCLQWQANSASCHTLVWHLRCSCAHCRAKQNLMDTLDVAPAKLVGSHWHLNRAATRHASTQLYRRTWRHTNREYRLGMILNSVGKKHISVSKDLVGCVSIQLLVSLVISLSITCIRVCLGVTKPLIQFWTSPEYKRCRNSLHKSLPDLDNIFWAFPHQIVTRLPRPLSELAMWKGSDFRSFLLFYPVCMDYCLENIWITWVVLFMQ